MVVSCQFRHLARESAGTASGDLALKHAGETHWGWNFGELPVVLSEGLVK